MISNEAWSSTYHLLPPSEQDNIEERGDLPKRICMGDPHKDLLRLDSKEGLHHAWHPSMEEDNETYPS
jgi:hypothetical protein